jgi:hypothetical protein
MDLPRRSMTRSYAEIRHQTPRRPAEAGPSPVVRKGIEVRARTVRHPGLPHRVASTGSDAFSRILRTAAQNEELITAEIRIAVHERYLTLRHIGHGLGIRVVGIGPSVAEASTKDWAPVPQPTSRISGAGGSSSHKDKASKVHAALPGPRRRRPL